MEDKEISVSILKYETALRDPNSRGRAYRRLRELVNAEIDYIHVDWMRSDFILGIKRFSLKVVSELFSALKNDIRFDIHMMDNYPLGGINALAKIFPRKNRADTFVTVHREAYRRLRTPYDCYNDKKYDLTQVDTGSSHGNQVLREADTEFSKLVEKTLEEIKNLGFRPGLALEPGTSLESVTPKMRKCIDLLLLMSVHSGAGGQEYMPEVTGKVRRIRYGDLTAKFEGVKKEVDGGIHNETIKAPNKAGADIFVVGSFITGSRCPLEKLSVLRRILRS